MKWILFLMILPLSIVEAKSKIKIKGEVRTRSEWNAKGLEKDDNVYLPMQVRTRVEVKAKTSKSTRINVHLQDNRYFGTNETISLSGFNSDSRKSQNASNYLNPLHVHEAYIDWRFRKFARLILGRQQVKLGSQRFIGSDNWYSGLSFDGAKLDVRATKQHSLSVMAFILNDKQAGISNDSNVLLTGINYEFKLNKTLNAQVYAFYDKNRVDTLAGIANGVTDLIFIGERIHGKWGSIFYDEEFILQLGEAGEKSVLAFNLNTRLGVDLQGQKLALGLDIMTGYDPDATDDYTRFENRYSTVHGLYGKMDYIKRNPEHGVVDWRIDGSFKLGKRIQVKPEFHFLTNSFQDKVYGTEYDLEVVGKLNKKSTVAFGGGFFLPNSDDAATNNFSAPGDEMGYYVYVMPTFRF